MRNARYDGWQSANGKALLASDFGTIAMQVENDAIDPKPRSGRQEILENIVNRFV